MHHTPRTLISSSLAALRAAAIILAVVAPALAVEAQDLKPAPDRPAASGQGIPQATRPTTRPGVIDYQRGIRINWPDRQVEAAGRVVLREGALELFACSPNTREHESIVRIDARPLHLFQALGLIGLTPGHPGRVHPQTGEYQGATGDPVEIEVQYEQDGQTRQEPIERWMRQTPPEGQEGPGADLGPLPWVFAGSYTTKDGVFAADPEGTVIAVVEFGSALIALPDYHSDSNAELWLQPATGRIPPLMTRCTLLFRRGPVPVGLDSAGQVVLGGRVLSLREATQALRDLLREDAEGRFRVAVDVRCPPEREIALLAIMDLLKIRRESITIARVNTSLPPRHDAKAVSQWVREFTASRPAEGSSRPAQTQVADQIVAEMEARAHILRGRVESVFAYLEQLTSGLNTALTASSSPATGPAPPGP
jgi:hypothetical protein